MSFKIGQPVLYPHGYQRGIVVGRAKSNSYGRRLKVVWDGQEKVRIVYVAELRPVPPEWL